MLDTLTGPELAGKIKKIVTLHPDMHDQGFWYRNYGENRTINYNDVNAEIINLDKILEAVEEDKEAPQCGTTLCVAGWALILNGYTLMRRTRPSAYGDWTINEDFAMKDGEEHDIEITAAVLLNLDTHETEDLFSESITNEQAVEALGYLENDHEIDWDEILGYDDDEDYEY